MKMYVFDFDGTLADTHKSIVDTTALTLKTLGLPPVDEDFLKSLIGLPIGESLRQAGNLTTEAQIKEAVDIYRDSYFKLGYAGVTLFPGVKDTLATLKQRGHTLAIATSRGRDSLKELLKVLDIAAYIDILKADEDAVNKKPAPDLTLAALADAGCAPEEAIVVGDTVYDIEMGRRAGCRTCAVTYGNQSRERLLTASPDIIIDSFTQLLDYEH